MAGRNPCRAVFPTDLEPARTTNSDLQLFQHVGGYLRGKFRVRLREQVSFWLSWQAFWTKAASGSRHRAWARAPTTSLISLPLKRDRLERPPVPGAAKRQAAYFAAAAPAILKVNSISSETLSAGALGLTPYSLRLTVKLARMTRRSPSIFGTRWLSLPFR